MDASTLKQAKARLLKETEEHKRETEGARQEIEKYRRKLQKAEMDLQTSSCERDFEVKLILQYDSVMSKRKEELARNIEHDKKQREEVERATRDAAVTNDKTKQQLERALRIYNRANFSDKTLGGGQSSRELRQAISTKELNARLEKALEEKRKLEAELKKVPYHEISYKSKQHLLHELAEDQKAMRKRLMTLKIENHALRMGIASSQ